ncbi:ATP-dependent RNA helicase [Thermoplasma volcanium GSS1]|uniref:ATP-dependent RNA helicase n=1 Tax=Thermoplasma volcanium (strain ATCC 51530 / DSM 4299 / JCM 9571 / NBRC 15438 / GSS1) TaxID=273116 RepID=Q97AH9_THEVO|nr:DEAD/DEAH box helicase [Thermoplasma volcanium]BAB59973.1 ATP-dependent RNA helicase [Thermoplasma volcanium GSS1]
MENAFDLLDKRIISVLQTHGITDPTDPQERIIPEILDGKNVLLLSPTGSGKTEAAVMPIFDMILKRHPDKIFAIYITPLRALNRDIVYRLVEYGKDLGIKVQVRHSDMTDSDRKRMTADPPDIVVTTPESLQILLNGRNLSKLISNVKIVVVDELHDAAENERGSQLSVALERLRDLAGNFQRIGLSATVGNPKDLAKFLVPEGECEIVATGLRKNMDIEVMVPQEASEGDAEIMGCDRQYAGAVLKVWELINRHAGSLVFVNRRFVAEDLAFRLRLKFGDIPVLVHHGSLSRETRENAENSFKEGKVRALICTSSLELGIDIGTASAVIQFNSPRQINKMIQRIGRSEHWIGRTSKGYVVCTDVIEMEEAIAIVDSIKEGKIEPVQIMRNSLSTLANQILSEVNSKKRVNVDAFFATVKRAYAFADLTYDEYMEVIHFLADTKKIWLEDKFIGKRRNTLRYYIENISMIPSEKNYKVIDITGKFIGTLDERYVASDIDAGSYFVMRGNTWRVIRLEKDRILVESFFTPAVAPRWTGEDIPVLYDVVDKVSKNRLAKRIPECTDEFSAEKLRQWYCNDVATSDEVIVESYNDEIVIQILLGTKGNFAVAEVLSNLLSSITGESVESDYSPYHIYLRTSRKIYADDAKKLILDVFGSDFEQYLAASAPRSRFFKSVFLYEARKFGVISAEADLDRIRIDKIMDAYMDTVLYRDSVRKLINDYMDVDALRSFKAKLPTINFILRDSISKSSDIFISHYSERITPLRPTKAILESVKNRIMNERVSLYCLSCGSVRSYRVRDLKVPKCEACGSRLVAALSDYERDRIKDPEYRKRIVKNAHLVKEKGIDAVMVLTARGIGPETASRILEVTYASEEDLIRAILNAEMDYARNRRFWD